MRRNILATLARLLCQLAVHRVEASLSVETGLVDQTAAMRAASAAPGDGGSIARPPSPSSLSKRLQLADHLCTRGSTWLHRICLENSADQRTYFDLCDSRGGPLPDEFHEGHDESTNPDPFPLGQFGRYSAVQGFTGSLPRRRLWPDFLHGERGMLNDRYYFVIGQCSDNHYCFTSPKDEDGHHHIQCVPRGRQPGYRDPTAKYYVYGEHVFLAPAQSDAGSGIAGSASSFDVEVTSAAQDAYMTAYMLGGFSCISSC